jgi:hypothetical protein
LFAKGPWMNKVTDFVVDVTSGREIETDSSGAG